VEVVEEEFRRGEENAVPSVAGPAEIVARLSFSPLAISCCWLMCQSMSMTNTSSGTLCWLKAGDNVVEFLVAVGPISATTKPEGEARAADPSRNPNIVAECLFVVVAVAEEVTSPPARRGRGMTHGQGCLRLFEKLKSAESKSGRVESSTSVHPSRETSRGQLVPPVLAPSASSSVRVVPCRLPVSGVRHPLDVPAVQGEVDLEVIRRKAAPPRECS